MSSAKRGKLRGQPLTVLVLVILGWAGVRTITWQPPDMKFDLLLGHEEAQGQGQAMADSYGAARPAAGLSPISYPVAYGAPYPSAYPPPGWGGWAAYRSAYGVGMPRYAAGFPGQFALPRQSAWNGQEIGAVADVRYASGGTYSLGFAESTYSLPGGDVSPRLGG